MKFIREQHGDYFGICVSGYPEAHPDVIVEDTDQVCDRPGQGVWQEGRSGVLLGGPMQYRPGHNVC